MGREKPAQIVCWKCKSNKTTLFAISNEDGTKDRADRRDYVCIECLPMYPRPPVGNCSKVFLPEKSTKVNLGREAFLAAHKPPVTAEKQTETGETPVNG